MTSPRIVDFLMAPSEPTALSKDTGAAAGLFGAASKDSDTTTAAPRRLFQQKSGHQDAEDV